MTKSKILSLFFLVSTALPLFAQDIEVEESWTARMWHKGIRLLTQPSKLVDSAYVYQVPYRWSFGVDNTQIFSTVDIQHDIQQTTLVEGESQSRHSHLAYHPYARMYDKVGASAGFGSLGVSYGVALGDNPGQNKYFTFGLKGSYYSLQVQNYVVNEYVDGDLESDALADPLVFESDYPARMHSFSVDGFYAFNGRHFAYTAPYAGKMLQRRSAGSFLVAAKYLQGDLALDGNDSFVIALSNSLGRVETRQVSLGGGYSFNWVFLHRDPSDPVTGKGIRNLTLNVTALPQASFYTTIDAFSYVNGQPAEQTHIDGKLSMTLTGHAALCYSWDRFSVNAQAHYNGFGFRGAQTLLWSDANRTRNEIDTNALFQDVTVKVQFFVRF